MGSTRVVFDEAAMRALFASAEGPIGKDLARRSVRVVRAAKKGMSAGGAGTHHIPSAPGQPPAVDTGRLRASIDAEMGSDAQGMFARIGTNVKYAPYLEFGTRKMAARPFLRPALKAAGGSIQ